MTRLIRSIRSSRQNTGVVGLVEAVLTSELLEASEEIWLISPWISDVRVLDNSARAFDDFLLDPASRGYRLSEILSMLATRGTRLRVVTRNDEHNDTFVSQLERGCTAFDLRVTRHDDLHEKTMCGEDWVISGSMNFTYNGLLRNDEATTFTWDVPTAASARLEFRQRWGR
ncbi:hypothetical protein C6I20_08005 [Aeromicrobium sp. A1-2]|uniref:phospholipase D-like domain-containing protein DpdK n=1 Tax=Aeromicrobium sp. A1-2 TaxID=2107713 RepID=UPI000E50CA6C|nr:phospholipase D-like domain-containing protein DpdK [Aeromicrobium sp. A1-2]AXT85130.1 hypothetical protein C6I20_08005 [Aeromicrobium sp. A1-2]